MARCDGGSVRRVLIGGMLVALAAQFALLQRVVKSSGAYVALRGTERSDDVLSLRRRDVAFSVARSSAKSAAAVAPMEPTARGSSAHDVTARGPPRQPLHERPPEPLPMPPPPPVPPGFTLHIGIDFDGHDLPTPPGGNPHTTIGDAARTCAANTRCTRFVMKGRPSDWRRGWAVYYKGGRGGAGDGSPNPSMFALVKNVDGPRRSLPSPAQRSVRIADAVSSAAHRPAAPAAPAASAAPRRCSNDAQCAALAPPGRSAVCLGAEREERHCYEGEGAWLSRLVPRRASPAQLFDGFLFNNEFDLLEVRLHELAPAVTAVILVEATFTFQNHAKPLYFEEYVAAHPARFAQWMDRIEHITIDGRPGSADEAEVGALRERAKVDQWAIEVFCRDAIAKRGIPLVRAKYGAGPDDLIMITDVRTQPNPDSERERLAGTAVLAPAHIRSRIRTCAARASTPSHTLPLARALACPARAGRRSTAPRRRAPPAPVHGVPRGGEL